MINRTLKLKTWLSCP